MRDLIRSRRAADDEIQQHEERAVAEVLGGSGSVGPSLQPWFPYVDL